MDRGESAVTTLLLPLLPLLWSQQAPPLNEKKEKKIALKITRRIEKEKKLFGGACGIPHSLSLSLSWFHTERQTDR